MTNDCTVLELLKSFFKDEIVNKEIICKNKSDSDKNLWILGLSATSITNIVYNTN